MENILINKLYYIGDDVYTCSEFEEGRPRVHGIIQEVAEDSILVKWDDLNESTEYDKDKISLVGHELHENKRFVQYIFELIEKKDKEIEGWKAIAESNRDANEEACKMVYYLREENELLKKQLKQ